jgi:hypothetical protein
MKFNKGQTLDWPKILEFSKEKVTKKLTTELPRLEKPDQIQSNLKRHHDTQDNDI